MALCSELAGKEIKRCLQMFVVNESYKYGDYKIPIHLAFRHEAIAVSINVVVGLQNQLICSRRNIHYSLIRECNL